MRLKRIILSDFMFFIIMLLLIVLSIFSYYQISNLNEQSEHVNHSNLVKLKLVQTLSHIRDAEARQRFFLLTRDSSYRLPYGSWIEQNQLNIGALDSLTKDDPQQRPNIQALLSLTKERFEVLYRVASSPGKTPADMQDQLADGKSLMEQISSTVDKMLAIEEELLTEKKSRRNYARNITPLFSLLLSVFALLIIGVTYFILRKETRLRFNVQDDIKKLNDYFKDLPSLFAIVKGPLHVHDMANTMYHEISGHPLIKGLSFRDAFPDLEGQGFYEALEKVYNSGETFTSKEMPLSLAGRDGKIIKRYFNFIFQPILNDQKKTDGILIFGYEITEMIRARKVVEETEQRSRLAIEAANIGTFDWDMKNKNFESSPRLLEIFGFAGMETNMHHQQLIERLHPLDKPIRDKAVENSYAKGTLSYEARIIWVDGSVHWISVHGKIIYNDLKEALRMYGTTIDVTEQKNALEELRESEAKFRLLADSMPQFVWTGDEMGNFDYFNKAVLDYTGLPLHELNDKGWLSILHPDDMEENTRIWMKAVSLGEEFVFEHRFKHFSGSYRWHLSRASPQKDAAGVVQRWVGTSTDIQDQKDLSQRLEQQIRDRTQELVELNNSLLIKNNIFTQAEENALIGSYSWNLDNGKLEYSDNLYRLFGYEPNEFEPSFEKYHSLVHPEDKEQVLKDGLETFNSKILSANTYRIITKDGTIKHFRSTGKIMGENEQVMLIGTVQDITQDIMLNEILRIKNLQLERSNAELESFNYIASHDLQEPLRKIQAFSERILQKEGANFSMFSRDYFSRINSSAARMQNLINALLNYSRADAAFKETAPVDLNSVLVNVKADLQEVIDGKNAVLEFAGLPVIDGVSIQVHQLFTNLVSNAVKYSRDGLPPRIVVTALRVTGNDIRDATADRKTTYWKILVADNGIGFEQEYEHKIFELFQRLHHNDDYMGTGIGLAICKKIMRNHQGFISATGIPGTGSIFSIYFPVQL